MYAHDRTLLASLGFADPDKKNPIHDLGCEYLTTVAKKDIIDKIDHHPNDRYQKDFGECIDDLPRDWSKYRLFPFTEFQLIKGDGKYRTTIGFVDAVIVTMPTVQEACCIDISYFEVKVTRTTIGQVKRQISLYREYEKDNTDQLIAGCRFRMRHNLWDSRWTLVTTYDVSLPDREDLLRSSIDHIRLGPKFLSWVKSRRERPSEPSSEI